MLRGVSSTLLQVLSAADESLLNVTWSDGHVSVYRTDWLRAQDSSPSALHERSHGSFPTPLCAWDAIPKVWCGVAVAKSACPCAFAALCVTDPATNKHLKDQE